MSLGIASLVLLPPYLAIAHADSDETPSQKAQLEETTLSPDLSVFGPWHFTNIWITLANAPVDIESYCVAFTIETDVTGNLPIYISPINQRLNTVPLYAGIQTRIDGFEDKAAPDAEKVYRPRGAIFSRWDERDIEATRQAPGGLFEISGYEGDFVSVRNDFAWSEGSYRLCLVKSDVVEGEALPQRHERTDVAFGWGRLAHVWVRLVATDVESGQETLIGSLAFPGESLSLDNRNAIFYEAYGSQTILPGDVRPFEVVVDGIEVDGEAAAYSEVVESVNPFGVHADAPTMVHTTYGPGSRIASRIGEFTGGYGSARKTLYSNP